MRKFQLLVIFFITLQASQAILRKNSKNKAVASETTSALSFASPYDCLIYTFTNVQFSDVYVRMEKAQSYSAIYAIDLHRGSPDKNDQWKISFYSSSNKWGYYICMKNVAMDMYLSLDTSGCSGSPAGSGCGRVGASANCNPTEQFVFQQVSNGHAALVYAANPHYVLRSDGSNIRITKVAKVDTSVYVGGGGLPQQLGGGVFNAQYYDDYETASGWESYDAHYVGSCL